MSVPKIILSKEVKNVIAGLLFVIFLVWLIRYFQLSFLQTYLLLIGLNAIMLLHFNQFTTKHFLKNIITIFIFMLVLRFVGKFGLIGFAASIALITFWILSTRWKKYLEVKHHIESLIWGKPLKEYIAEGKKPPKLKITVR